MQHVKVPTRKSAILDLVVTTELDLIDEIETMEFLGGGDGDHKMLDWIHTFW